MTRTVIYFGPPGTGKTATLLGKVREALDSGIDPGEIAFVAFTRRAAAEARARAAAELKLSGDDLRHWRTLHSTAARQLGVGGRGDLLQREHWDELGMALGLRFGDVDETGESVSMMSERGTRLRHLEQIARATRKPLRSIWDGSDREVPWLELERFSRTLVSYKQDRRLLDYADLLDEAPGDLPIRVACLDEAQDLTPAQWDYASRALSRAEVLYVAGDDDQAIYDWAGGDVRRFLSTAGERLVLRKSHRLPRAVWERAGLLAGRIRNRQAKDWEPRDADGAVVDAPSPEAVPVWDGEWLLLARTRGLLDHWEYVCREAGVPYVRSGIPAVRPDEALAVRAWETLRRGGSLSAADLEVALAKSGRNVTGLDPDETHTAADAGLAVPLAPWRSALVRIPPARRRYYEACLRRSPRALTDAARVTISTVHGAKGGEAARVGVIPDWTPRCEAHALRNPDAEHRVWYVAATRAREELHLVRSVTGLSYRI